MPLFVCANKKCKCIENTALSGCSWGNPRGEMLCSKCCAKNLFCKPYTWHDKFPREKFDPKKHKIVDGFLERIGIKVITANNEEVKLVSDCCGAEIKMGGLGDFSYKDGVTAQFMVCLKCGEPCDQKLTKK